MGPVSVSLSLCLSVSLYLCLSLSVCLSVCLVNSLAVDHVIDTTWCPNNYLRPIHLQFLDLLSHISTSSTRLGLGDNIVLFDTRHNSSLLNTGRFLKTITVNTPQQFRFQVHIIKRFMTFIPRGLNFTFFDLNARIFTGGTGFALKGGAGSTLVVVALSVVVSS